MLAIEFYKRQSSQLDLFVKPSDETASLKVGAVGTLTTGDEVTFTGSSEYPSGKFARFVASPSVKLKRTDALATGDAERADIFLRIASEAAPKGNSAILLRAPLGALTEGGKVLRAVDAATDERDASSRLRLAREAARLSYLWAKREAPFPAPSLADVKTADDAPKVPKLEPSTNYDPAPSGSPWGLGALALVAVLVVGGYVVAGEADDDEE